VNEQTLIGLLLAGPGVIATLTFAPMVIALLYSTKFGAAVQVLRWICLGATLQVITWPMSFIIVAKGKRAIFFCVELAWGGLCLSLALLCVKWFGLEGAGIAFLGSYVVYGLLLLPIVRRLSGFRWSIANMQTGLLFLVTIALVFSGFYLLPPLLAASIGTFAALLSTLYSIRVLVRLVPWDRIPRPMRKLLVAFRLVPPGITSVD
jgi:antigen flippase